MRVVFRCDANGEKGGGHVMRCLTLAGRLSSAGWRPVFAVGQDAPTVLPALPESGFEYVIVPEPDDRQVMFKRWPEGADLLVTDDYGIDADFESSCRGWANKILAVDDLADRPHDCDFLLDQTPGRMELDYQDLTPQGCRMLLGSGYALLRPGFAGARPAALDRRKNSDSVRRVLISFGLTDPAAASAAALQGVLDCGREIEVDVVLGKSSPAYDRVSGMAEDNKRVTLHEYVHDMPKMMARADLALGAPGTSAWERCCLGLPSIVMIVAENQKDNAVRLEVAGAGVNLGRAGEVSAGDVARKVAQIIDDSAVRAEMSIAAADMCDGLGAERAALAVQPKVAARGGGQVGLRFAGQHDVDAMFDWQSDPETRRYANNPEIPSRSEHEAWFKDSLVNPRRKLFVVTHEDRDAGIFRLDRLDGGGYMVSIVVAPDMRGRGVGAAVLEFADRFWSEEVLKAEILPGNEASLKMFTAAGYRATGGKNYVRAAHGNGE